MKYELPFGLLGDLVHAIYVKSDVQRIFAYRRSVIEELLVKKIA